MFAAVPVNVVVLRTAAVVVEVRAAEKLLTGVLLFVHIRSLDGAAVGVEDAPPLPVRICASDPATGRPLSLHAPEWYGGPGQTDLTVHVLVLPPAGLSITCTADGTTLSPPVTVLTPFAARAIGPDTEPGVDPADVAPDEVIVEHHPGVLPEDVPSVLREVRLAAGVVGAFTWSAVIGADHEAMLDLLTVFPTAFTVRVRTTGPGGVEQFDSELVGRRTALWLDAPFGTTPQPLIAATRTWGSSTLELCSDHRGTSNSFGDGDAPPFVVTSDVLAVRLTGWESAYLSVRMDACGDGAVRAWSIDLPLARIGAVQQTIRSSGTN